MAAGRNLTAKFILTLRDGVSSGLGALRNRLDGLMSTARRIGAIGAGVAAISFAGPIASAAAYQDALLQTQITAGGVGASAVLAAAEAGRAYERLALETGTRSRDLVTAAQNLVAAGLTPTDVAAFMPVLARTATATGASLDDLSRTTVALRQNLGITSADALAGALASMATAGKAGMFELRDMAREFPQLTAAAQSLGLTGRTAVDSLSAMLQVARQGAGSSSEAANNLANFLQKLTSPETVQNFRKLGVNLQGVLADAARQGINPIEAVIQKIRERTGGDMFQVGSLFGDRQVLDFLRPMLRGTQEYLDILKSARAANAALIDQDFATRMLGAQMKLNETLERGEQILRRIGLGAASSLGPVLTLLETVQAGMAWMDTNYPGVIDQTIGWAASVVFLAGALGVLVPVVGFIWSGLVLLLSPLRLIGPALRLMLGPVRLLATGLALLGAPFAGVIAAVAALTGLAILMWSEWDSIGPWFRRLWEGVKSLFSGFVAWVDDWTGGALSRTIGGITGAWDSAAQRMRRLLGDLGQVAGEILGPPFRALQSLLISLWGPIELRIKQFVDWVRTLLAPLLAIIESIRTAATPAPSTNPAMAPEAQAERSRRGGSAGRAAAAAGGFYAPEATIQGAAPAGPAQLQGRIVIETAPGVTVRDAETNQPGLRFERDPGAVLSRP